jgi:hypothetical protein
MYGSWSANEVTDVHKLNGWKHKKNRDSPYFGTNNIQEPVKNHMP